MTPEFWHRLLSAELSPALAPHLIGGPGTSNIEEVLASPQLSEGERHRIRTADLKPFEELLKQGLRVIEPEEYPQTLLESRLVPLVLFVLGEWEVVHEPAIAIVGTRNASTYGKACSLKFSEAFAEAGVTVISGGALGIDGCAHKGALNVGGKTAAVMFTGLDKTYPREHAGLFQKVRSDGGCLISQFTTGQKPAHETRPLIRNQIIAALAQAVVVIEAPAQSGSLSTVHAANDLGRPVFVVPANVDNLNFKGSHALIRDGATLVDHPFQVLNALGIEPKLRDRPAPQVNDPQRKILLALSEKPLSSEMIVERTGLPTADVLSELTMLELEGIILRDVGGFAIRP